MRKAIRKWFHDKLGWHDGKGGAVEFDGASLVSKCSICGKRVLQDSQGNWFPSLIQDEDEGHLDPDAVHLWGMLDDIDTASDMIKPRDLEGYKRFYEYAMKKAAERHGIAHSPDGYKLVKPCEYIELDFVIDPEPMKKEADGG